MLGLLRETGRATPRKLRLLACACCRLLWPRLRRASRSAVEAAELLADGLLEEEALAKAVRAGMEASWNAGESGQSPADMAYRCLSGTADYAVEWTALGASLPAGPVAHLVRDVFGNPF